MNAHRALMPARVYYQSGIAAAEAAMAARKSVVVNGIEAWTGSRQDGLNFRTNMVTLADYQDGHGVGDGAVLGLAAAWACVNLLAGTIASLPLMVYRTDRAGRRTLAPDHPLYRILHDSPNADQTALDFWEFICACIEMRGNGFAEIVRAGDGRVISLDVPVPPQAVKVRRQSNGSLEYEWTLDGRTQRLPQERMLHIRGFGGSPLGGLSTIAYGAGTFGGAVAVERSARATFRNGMRPSVALESDNLLTAEQRKQLETVLQEKYQGAMNSGVPFISDNGLKLKVLGFNPEESQMLESRAFSVEQICMMFGVPPHMIGHTEKVTSWGTGLEQQTLGFQKFTLRRRLKRMEMALEKQLLGPKDRMDGITIEFSLEGLLRADSAARSKFYGDMSRIGAMTINEIRALENLPPVEGGDVPRMQAQNVPITEAAGLNGPPGE